MTLPTLHISLALNEIGNFLTQLARTNIDCHFKFHIQIWGKNPREIKVSTIFLFEWSHRSLPPLLITQPRISNMFRAHFSNLIEPRFCLMSILNYKPCHMPLKHMCLEVWPHKVDGSRVDFPAIPPLLGYETCDSSEMFKQIQIKATATFLMIFVVHTNVLFNIKVNILCSLNGHIILPCNTYTHNYVDYKSSLKW